MLTAWVHSSLCFTDANCTCEIYGGQGAGCPSVWNARPGETAVKEVAIKLDAHPLTHTLDKSCCPQTPSSGIQSHEYMSAVLHCYLNVMPLKFFNFINNVLIFALHKSDSIIHVYIHIIFHIIFHSGLSQDTEYSSLCYTVGPCCLSIIYIIVCIC